MSESLIALTNDLALTINKINELEEAGEPIPNELIVSLEMALTAQAEKVDRCAMFVSRAKSEVDWIDGEIELLAARKKQIERGVDRIKDLAKFVMEREGVKELTGMRGHKFSLRESQSVDVIDETKVPESFLRTIPEKKEVNKAEALKALKAGVQIDGLGLNKKVNVVVK